MQLLNRQIAASDFMVLKNSMLGSYLGATVSLPGLPGSGSMAVPLMRNDGSGHPGSDSLPRTSLKMKHLVTGLRMGYKYFQGGKFNDAKTSFEKVLADIPMVVADSKAEANEIKEMVEICREYITAIRIKAGMAAVAADPVRSTELSAYFTHCNLQPVHLLLALRSAMGTAFKHKNFIVAASFARRLLELPDMNSERNADLRVKATKVLPQRAPIELQRECCICHRLQGLCPHLCRRAICQVQLLRFSVQGRVYTEQDLHHLRLLCSRCRHHWSCDGSLKLCSTGRYIFRRDTSLTLMVTISRTPNVLCSYILIFTCILLQIFRDSSEWVDTDFLEVE